MGKVPLNIASVAQAANGAISLKVEQTKLPDFWVNKSKDVINEIEFIESIDEMIGANNWEKNVSYHNFAFRP